MKRLTCVLSIVCGLGLFSLWFDTSSAADTKADPKAPTVKDLMRKTHKGDDSPLMRVDRQLKSEEPAWGDVSSDVKQLVAVADLVKQNPVGYRDSRAYLAAVESLNTATGKKDHKAASAAFVRVKQSCASCHTKDMP